MKFLEIPIFAQLNSLFSGVTSISGDSRIYGHIEAYSCKRVGSDKKFYKSMEEQYQVELSKSPSDSELLATSPFGPLSESSSRKTLIYLISLLNVAFPDYDFSNVQAQQFKKELSSHMVINSINTTLNGVIKEYSAKMAPMLWSALETEILVKDCDIYSFMPDLDSDPYADDGSLWNFNYFFYNKKLRRIIFFTCHALSPDNENISDMSSDGNWDDDEMENMDV